ncbi:MAG: hypothetical protein ACQEQV_02235 [Fibrobacterota bacterium]
MDGIFTGSGAAFLFGTLTGAFSVLLLSILVFVLTAKIRRNADKNKDLVGKTVSGMMRKVNQLFIEYRLGDITFEQMERESRDIISQIDEEVSENSELLNNSYISVIQQYIDEKNETLIAIKEDAHHYRQQNSSRPASVSAPVQEEALSPDASADVSVDTGFDRGAASSAAVESVPEAPKAERPAQETLAGDTAQKERDSNPFESMVNDLDRDEELSLGDPAAESSGEPASAQAGGESDFDSLIPEEHSDMRSLSETMSAQSVPPPSPEAAAPKTDPSSEPSSGSGLRIDEDEFTSAIDKAFSLDDSEDSFGSDTLQGETPSAFSERREPVQSEFSQDNPFEGSSDNYAAGPYGQHRETPSSDTNPDLSEIDVEATQEFNLNDIMSQAEPSGDRRDDSDDDMVSGSDVANKLDDLFR